MYYNIIIITTLLISITKSLKNSFKYYSLNYVKNFIRFWLLIKCFKMVLMNFKRLYHVLP